MFKQKKLSLGARFGLSVASFVLGLLLFVSAIATSLIANIRIVTSEDNISGMFKVMMSAPAHVRPKAPVTSGEGGLRIAPRLRTYQMPRREEPDNVADGLIDQIIEMFYDELGDQFTEDVPVSKEEFTQMINESTVKDYIADKAASLVTDFFNDEITTTFEPEEIVQLINENSALIESITGAPLPDDIAQQVAQVFDENEIVVKVEQEGLAGFMEMLGNEGPGLDAEGSPDTDVSKDSSSNPLSFVKKAVNTVSQIASVPNLIFGISICLVLIAAIILINCRQLGKGLRRAGYPLMLAGCMVILNLLAKYVPDLWAININSDAAAASSNLIVKLLLMIGDSVSGYINPILKLIRHILLQTAVVNIAVFGTGLALFVAGIVLSIVLRPKKDAPVSIPATAETEELAAAIVDETPVQIVAEPAEETAPEVVCEEASAEEVEEEAPVEEIAEEENTKEAAPVGE